MTTVHLFERGKAGDGPVYYTLKWRGSRGNWQRESIGRTRKSGGKVTAAMAERRRVEKEHAIVRGDVPVDRPRRGAMTFGQLRGQYRELREESPRTGRGYRKDAPRLCALTITSHLMTIRYLANHFGDEKGIDAIDDQDAEAFIEALAAGELTGARSINLKRAYTLGEQTIRGHIRNCKAIFTWARLMRFVATNPFSVFDGHHVEAKAKAYVPLEVVEKVIAVAPTGWRVLLGLTRLAGLRLCEALELPWAGEMADAEGKPHWVGVDWERGRLCVVGRHKSRRSRVYREVPVEPRLDRLLADAFQAAADGSVTVTGLSSNNLMRNAHRLCTAACVEPWPCFFQAMRVSHENDWKVDGIPEVTYCTWMGHAPETSRKHYVSPTDVEFALVTGKVPKRGKGAA